MTNSSFDLPPEGDPMAPGLHVGRGEMDLCPEIPMEDYAMSAETLPGYTLVLNDKERTTLEDILEEVLKETRVELHRTERFAAQQIVRAREKTIESLLAKVRQPARQ
jgi:hypothetical protein